MAVYYLFPNKIIKKLTGLLSSVHCLRNTVILFYSGSTGSTWDLPALTFKIVTYIAISCAKNKSIIKCILFLRLPGLCVCTYMFLNIIPGPSNKAAF